MSDTKNDAFHKISIISALFKGQEVLYFCYRKAEKIAHAIVFLCEVKDRSVGDHDTMVRTLLHESSCLPKELAELAAGELSATRVLARIYGLLSQVRLCASHGLLEDGNSVTLVREYEAIAERMIGVTPKELRLSVDEFDVPALEVPVKFQASFSPLARAQILSRGNDKGHDKRHDSIDGVNMPVTGLDVRSERSNEVLKILSEQERVSIKDISKKIRNCGEKTIQRELNSLIAQGAVRKEGERRWSVYIKV